MTACGGNDKQPVAQAVTKAVIPQIILPAVPASEASAPVAASEPAAPVAASTPMPASDPVPASTPIVRIDVFGDDAAMGLSSYGFGMPTMVKPASASLQDSLQKQFNDTGIQVANHASGGRAASLANLLDGMDGAGAPFAQRLASTQSTIIVISYGLNEQYGGQTVANFSGYLAQAIQTVRDAGRVPVLEEPGPTCDTDHQALPQYVAAIDAAAKQYGIPVIANYNAILGLPNWEAHMDSTCALPDETLDTFKAKQELEVIAPLVKAQIGE